MVGDAAMSASVATIPVVLKSRILWLPTSNDLGCPIKRILSCLYCICYFPGAVAISCARGTTKWASCRVPPPLDRLIAARRGQKHQLLELRAATSSRGHLLWVEWSPMTLLERLLHRSRRHSLQNEVLSPLSNARLLSDWKIPRWSVSQTRNTAVITNVTASDARTGTSSPA